MSKLKVNMNRVDLENSLRRYLVSKLPTILNCVTTGDYRRLTQYCPVYTIAFPTGFKGDDTRYLTPYSTRQKGKRRIYCDSKFHAGPDDVYVSYLNRAIFDKFIDKDESAATKNVEERFLNRWCVTIGNPVTNMASIYQFLHAVLMVEANVSRDNHPPLGDTSNLGPWKLGPCFHLHCKTGQSLPSEILCTVDKFNCM